MQLTDTDCVCRGFGPVNSLAIPVFENSVGTLTHTFDSSFVMKAMLYYLLYGGGTEVDHDQD